jgi:hypothetical protein
MLWRAGLGESRRCERPAKKCDWAGNQCRSKAEVVAGCGEHRAGAVAVAAREIVASHAVVVLEMTGDRLDGCAPRISRRMALLMRRSCPVIQTRERCGWADIADDQTEPGA